MQTGQEPIRINFQVTSRRRPREEGRGRSCGRDEAHSVSTRTTRCTPGGGGAPGGSGRTRTTSGTPGGGGTPRGRGSTRTTSGTPGGSGSTSTRTRTTSDSREDGNTPGGSGSRLRHLDVVSNDGGVSTPATIDGPGSRTTQDPATLWEERGLGRCVGLGVNLIFPTSRAGGGSRTGSYLTGF
ncbi:hypothetical protein NDU88_001928 [Pleurodeles waltl]|uniref:Uncharacterized protein n=1 Tax=Pleurodeles waltl TaxID=8319 RepID=A0AAV7KXI0_PLEWA|nr:hypothetical protein NDU88_001928 [Pleurodeles waltl]